MIFIDFLQIRSKWEIGRPKYVAGEVKWSTGLLPEATLWVHQWGIPNSSMVDFWDPIEKKRNGWFGDTPYIYIYIHIGKPMETSNSEWKDSLPLGVFASGTLTSWCWLGWAALSLLKVLSQKSYRVASATPIPCECGNSHWNTNNARSEFSLGW